MEITFTAGRVAAEWPVLIGQLPKELTKAINAYESVAYVEPPAPAFDTTIDPAKAIADLADQLATADQFARAKQMAAHTLARKVVRVAGDTAPTILDTIQDAFDEAVEEYTASVAALPEGITPDSLVDSGPSVLEAYQAGVAAAGDLRRFDVWLSSLSELPAYAGFQPESAIRITAPANRAELAALLNATAVSEAEYKLNPVWLAAARDGVEFRMVTPDEAAGIRAAIDAEPTPRFAPFKFAKV